MTRSRDIANLGTQAGSGLDASDITTGTMGAVTLGSTVVFPSGKIVNVFRYTDTSGNVNTTANNSTPTIAHTHMSFSATSGRHYLIFGCQQLITSNESGSNFTTRKLSHGLYWGTTSRSASDTTVDTKIYYGEIGRTQSSNSTAGYPQYIRQSYQGYFTAGSTATHYVYTTINNASSDNLKNYADNDAASPHIITVYEVMP